MFNMIIIWLLLFLVAVSVLFVYYLIYTKRINRQVCGGIRKGKRMPGLPKAFMAATVVLLLSISVVNLFAPAQAAVASRNDFAVIDTSDYSYIYIGRPSFYDLEDASYARMFSEKGNQGYTREVVVDGDFRFTVFTSTAPPDSFHPDFLCYVTYIGSGAEALSWNGQYVEKSTGGKNSIGVMGDVMDQSWLFVGNNDEKCCFMLTVGAYDRAEYESFCENEDMEKEMESFASSVSSVVIGGE